MKMVKALPVILVLAAIIAVLPGCSSNSPEETAATQTAAVTRGNLIVDISAAGNLALAETQDLAVDLFYPTGTKGTIGEVLVEEGDSVTKGQLLVTLDKNEWDDQMAALEDLVTAKERALVQAQINVKTAEQTLKNAHDTVAAKELAVVNAEIGLQQTESTLATAISAVDYQAALANLRKARTWLDYVSTTYKTIAPTTDDFSLVLEDAQERLKVAQAEYDNTLAGYNEKEVTLKKNQSKAAEMTLAAAESDLIDAQDDVALKELSLSLVHGNLQDAEKALEDAKNNLEEALKKSPEILAPFDGFITQVNVAGGDEVLNGTVAVQIADPDKFEADILVSEMDIPKVKIGSQATVAADALPGTILFATVTHISPTATISSGVVNYSVRVEVQSPGSSPFGQFGGMPGAADNGTAPGGGGFTFPGGSAPSGDFKFGDFKMPEGSENSSGFEFPAFSGNQSFGQFFPVPDTSVQLREGLTVTVTIVADSRMNVLIVPNGAIIKEGLENYVQVIKDTGEQEKRPITVGLSNWIFTEVTEGLEEGEQVNVMLNLAPDFDFGGGMMFMGGPR